MTTGVGFARARSSRHTSNPFLRGSVMSRITRSGDDAIALLSPPSPSAAAPPESVLARQRDVEDHEIGRRRNRLAQPVFAVGRGHDLVAFELEVVTQTEQHLRLGPDHQYSFSSRGIVLGR